MKFDNVHRPLNLQAIGGEEKKDNTAAVEYSSSLEKGEIAEAFGYSGNFNINKTGKEIKTGLEKALKFLQTKEVEYKKEMDKYLGKTKIKPSQYPSKYLTKGLEAQFAYVPKFFSYKVIDQEVKEKREKSPTYSYEECALDQYNSAARKYVDYCVEIIYTKVLLAGLNDNNHYYLNLKQSALAGIGN